MLDSILQFIQTNEWLISIAITIGGFIITSINLTKNLANEIKKTKQEISINAMTDIPFELYNLMEELGDTTKKGHKSYTDKALKEYKKIMSKILCYGSSDLVKIATYSQRNNYNTLPESTQWTILVLFSIMIVQMKYDLTGAVISPESYFNLKINDYEVNMKLDVQKDINRLVKLLDLNKDFLVKEG